MLSTDLQFIDLFKEYVRIITHLFRKLPAKIANNNNNKHKVYCKEERYNMYTSFGFTGFLSGD